MAFVSKALLSDTNAIDYMEYYFIQKVISAGVYSVENKDERKKEPASSLNHCEYVAGGVEIIT